MREIKFRVYDKHLKLIRDVAYIDFDGREVMYYIDSEYSMDIVRDFDEVEIMQYTGLKDKNGIEICEGDILLQKTTEEFKKYNSTVWEKTWEVVWGYHDIDPSSYPSVALGFHLKDVKSGMLKTIGELEQDCLDNCYPYEVIGNIWEDGDLLNDSE